MAVVVLDNQSQEATELSRKLQLPLVSEPTEYFLTKIDGLWEIQDPRQGKGFRLRVDLRQELAKARQRKINPKKDLLCRALGYKADQALTVLDGTLGMAKDALHLLSCGIKVVGVEREPLVHFLLEQSIATEDGALDGLQIILGDVLEAFPKWASRVDALYLDPMFENLKQKSAPKKGLAFLRELTSFASLPHDCMEKAIQFGIKRVVVKRPIKSENLFGKPNIVYEGKLIRYDVYTRL